MTAADVEAPRLRTQLTWMHSRRVDLALIFCWAPLALAVIAFGGNARVVQAMAAGVLLLSLAHQPITMALVYGEPQQLRQRRAVFVVAPVILFAAIWYGLQVSVVLVAFIGAAWNTEHTLMQRYGIVRIYRRKAGDRAPGRLDFHLLMSWLAVTLAWVVADPRTGERIDSLALKGLNQRSAELLVDIRPAAVALLLLSGAYAVVSTIRWTAREIAEGFSANRAVYLYVGGTAALFIVAVIDPIAGFVAWVGSHAIEYFLIVSTNLAARYPDPAPEAARPSLLHHADGP